MTEIVPEAEKRKGWAKELNSLEYSFYEHKNGELTSELRITSLKGLAHEFDTILERWASEGSFNGISEAEAETLAENMTSNANSIVDALQEGNRPQKREFIQLVKFLRNFSGEIEGAAEKLANSMNSGAVTDIDKKWENRREELIGRLEMLAFKDDFSGNREQAEAAHLEDAQFDYETDMTTLSQTNSALDKLDAIAKEFGWSVELEK